MTGMRSALHRCGQRRPSGAEKSAPRLLAAGSRLIEAAAAGHPLRGGCFVGVLATAFWAAHFMQSQFHCDRPLAMSIIHIKDIAMVHIPAIPSKISP